MELVSYNTTKRELKNWVSKLPPPQTHTPQVPIWDAEIESFRSDPVWNLEKGGCAFRLFSTSSCTYSSPLPTLGLRFLLGLIYLFAHLTRNVVNHFEGRLCLLHLGSVLFSINASQVRGSGPAPCNVSRPHCALIKLATSELKATSDIGLISPLISEETEAQRCQ